MQIPRTFQLFGQTITVQFITSLIEDEDSVGLSLYRKNLIQIQGPAINFTRPSTHIESTFFHELMHYIFYMLDEDEMRKNEQLVDNIARLLHQALTTACYEEDGNGSSPILRP